MSAASHATGNAQRNTNRSRLHNSENIVSKLQSPELGNFSPAQHIRPWTLGATNFIAKGSSAITDEGGDKKKRS
ncbi:hypothetical protein H0H92_015396 [Tricholoma furcatifolium]|nr:hypothetical protein H0H92_015396 [Tricholoma furcatifolium]